MRHSYLPPVILPLVILYGAAATLAAQTNPSFELQNYNSSGPNTGAIVQGDFNGDGKPDVIEESSGAPIEIILLAGNGDGTFQAPKTVATITGYGFDLAVGDMNNDGKLDLAIANEGQQSIDVLFGNGDGTFQSPVSVATSSYPMSVAIGDFNGDGYPDIAVGDQKGQIEIFDNAGGKGFVAGTSIAVATTNNEIIKVRPGDMDGNGTTDLGVLTYTAAYVLWGNGKGNFTPAELSGYVAPADLNIGDVNQDGMADIIVTYTCNPTPTGVEGGKGNGYNPCAGIDVFYGQGNQQTVYRLAVSDPDVSSPGYPWAVDINGDGIADIATAADGGSSQTGLYVWLGHPDGSFDQTPQQYIATTDGFGATVPGDFNRDGRMDFAMALPGNATTEFYLNATSRAPCATSQINPTVTVCQPVNGTYLSSPIEVQATTYDKNPVTALQEYIDGQLAYSADVNTFNINFTENVGPHLLVTKAWDSTGLSFQSDRTITVYNGSPGPVCPAALGSASICLPSNASTTSPIQILANGYTSVVPTAAQLYIDGSLVVNNQGDCYGNGNCSGGTSYVQTSQSLSSGSHNLVFKLWDADGNVYSAQKSVTVQ